MKEVYRLYGLPQEIISDRDKIFLSRFWKGVFKHMGTKLSMSTAYHPQSDGQTERVNRCLETYLRCMVFHNPRNWSKWLALAEFWYNTNYHTALKVSPFQALYGYSPPMLSTDAIRGTQHDVQLAWLKDRQGILSQLKDNLHKAQNRMKHYADQHRTERILQVGDWAYLKLHPYRQISASVRRNIKLTAKYFGPYKVLEKVGNVAYRLQLPPGCLIHHVFHVSQLKGKVKPNTMVQEEPPTTGLDGEILVEPVAALGKRLVKKNNAAEVEILVQWANLPVEEATWESYHHMKKQFPHFDTWGQGSVQGGSTVMVQEVKGNEKK